MISMIVCDQLDSKKCTAEMNIKNAPTKNIEKLTCSSEGKISSCDGSYGLNSSGSNNFVRKGSYREEGSQVTSVY